MWATTWDPSLFIGQWVTWSKIVYSVSDSLRLFSLVDIKSVPMQLSINRFALSIG